MPMQIIWMKVQGSSRVSRVQDTSTNMEYGVFYKKDPLKLRQDTASGSPPSCCQISPHHKNTRTPFGVKKANRQGERFLETHPWNR